MNRPLDAHEGYILHLVLDDLQDAQLLEQERTVTVTGGTPTFIDLDVAADATRSPVGGWPTGVPIPVHRSGSTSAATC